MNFETATRLRDTFEAQMHDAGAALKSVEGVGTGVMGLTPDSVKKSPEYVEAKRRFDWDFDNLRKFNTWYVKEFAKELRELRNKKFA
jgi:hypothetical protein